MFGVPSVRVDLAAPLLRRVSDRRNFGDESDVKGLVYSKSVGSLNYPVDTNFMSISNSTLYFNLILQCLFK